jgi:HEAT repeat protein
MMKIPVELLQQIKHPNLSERSKAVLALCADDYPSGDVLDVLLQALRDETDILVREDISFALMNLGDNAIDALVDLLQDDDPNVRHHAAHTLGKIGNPIVIDDLVGVLHDESDTVVHKAVYALGQIGDVRAVSGLVKILGHPNADVQTNLVKALTYFGASSIPYITGYLKADDWAVREQAVDILGQIQDQSVIPLLKQSLADPDWRVRLSAVNAIGNYGVAIARSILKDKPNDQSKVVQQLVDRFI